MLSSSIRGRHGSGRRLRGGPLVVALRLLLLLRATVLLPQHHLCQAQTPPPLISPYVNWTLVNKGALVVSALEDLYCCEQDIAYPSVVMVPTWVTNRPDPTARYYLYYGEHHGRAIRMKWAPTIEGPWTPFRSGNGTSSGGRGEGVLDFTTDTYRTLQRPGPENWQYLGSPDVHIDHVNRVFILAFTGRIINESVLLSNGVRYSYGLSSYVAFSHDGLNFNDPISGGGQPGRWGPMGYRLPYGPLEQRFLNTSRGNITVTTAVGTSFVRLIDIRGRLYGFHTLGVISRPQHTASPWHFASTAAYHSNARLWIDQTTPDALWTSGVDAELERYKTSLGPTRFTYTSHIATWFASSRFLSHPNNPSRTLPGGPYSVSSATGLAKVNHLAVYPLDANRIEVFIYIRVDTDAEYPVNDPFRDLLRIELNVTSDNYNDWSILSSQKADRVVDVLDVTLTPFRVRRDVVAANGGRPIDPTKYADPASLGVPSIIRIPDASKYCFIGFNSLTRQPDFAFSEGQIVAIRLTTTG
jgi:hypothetical protein